MDKNILIIGSNSELAHYTIEELKQKPDYKIFATSRQTGVMDKKIHEFYLDISNEMDFLHLKEKINNIKFDIIINFAGIAIADAVEQLNELELKKQLDINLFGLLRIIKYICPNLKENGKLINVSSMATYGIFPFLSPYCISKQSADILLNLYSVESNIKVVSIRPGAVATKFWESSIKLNEERLNKEDDKFQEAKNFLIDNANKNSLKATNPIYVAKKIAHIIELKNPKEVYNIGFDAKVAKMSRFLPQKITNFIVKSVLKSRIKRNK